MADFAAFDPIYTDPLLILSNDDRTIAHPGGSIVRRANISSPQTTGKHSFEVEMLSPGTTSDMTIGITTTGTSLAAGSGYIIGDFGDNPNEWGWQGHGFKWHNGSSAGAGPALNAPPAYAMIMWDCDTGTLTLKSNGSAMVHLLYVVPALIGVPIFPIVGGRDGATYTLNTGQIPFVNTPEAGYENGWGNGGGEDDFAYATLDPDNTDENITLSDDNLTACADLATTTWYRANGDIPQTSGQWAFEINSAGVSGGNFAIGVTTDPSITTDYVGSDADSYGYIGDGFKAHSAVLVDISQPAPIGAYVLVMYDADTGELAVRINNGPKTVLYTDPSLIGVPVYPAISVRNETCVSINFGQSAFENPLDPGYNDGWWSGTKGGFLAENIVFNIGSDIAFNIG